MKNLTIGVNNPGYHEVRAANDGVRRTISLSVPEPDDGDDIEDAPNDHDG